VMQMVALATAYGRYGYRRITALLRQAGWRVNAKRIERLWRQEGLKVPARQPKRSRLWLRKLPRQGHHAELDSAGAGGRGRKRVGGIRPSASCGRRSLYASSQSSVSAWTSLSDAKT